MNKNTSIDNLISKTTGEEKYFFSPTDNGELWHKNLNYESDSFLSELTFKLFTENKHRSIKYYDFRNLFIPNDSLVDLLDSIESLGYIVHQTAKSFYFFVENNLVCQFSSSSSGYSSGTLSYVSGTDIDSIVECISLHSSQSSKIEIKWFTDDQGDYYNITEIYKDNVIDELYPYIAVGIDDYINKFLSSNESILIFIGPPGTGKTSLLRYIVSKINKKAYVTYNENVLSRNDNAFGEFISNDSAGVFIIEDSDLLLRPRESGNELMSKFLNVGDGIIKLNGKKLIFTTNLPSVKDIDSAIMRKGRCFDVLHFRNLSLSEANVVCKKFNLPEILEDRKLGFSLAEIFNGTSDIDNVVPKMSKIGFYN